MIVVDVRGIEEVVVHIKTIESRVEQLRAEHEAAMNAVRTALGTPGLPWEDTLTQLLDRLREGEQVVDALHRVREILCQNDEPYTCHTVQELRECLGLGVSKKSCEDSTRVESSDRNSFTCLDPLKSISEPAPDWEAVARWLAGALLDSLQGSDDSVETLEAVKDTLDAVPSVEELEDEGAARKAAVPALLKLAESRSTTKQRGGGRA